MSSAPAATQLQPGRDAFLFLTLRKLLIAGINLAAPHPLEVARGRAPVVGPLALQLMVGPQGAKGGFGITCSHMNEG